MEIDFFNALGTIGAALILLGFYRTSIGKWKSKSVIYELDNLVGGTLLFVYHIHFKAYIGAVLNVIWMIVAFRGLTSFAERYYAHAARNKKSHR